MTSSTKKYLGHIILRSASYAGFGSLFGAVGAKILTANQHEGYSVLETVQAAAAGDAIIGGAIGMVWDPLRKCLGKEKKNDNMSQEEYIAEIALAAVTNVLGGMLGKLILQEIIEMPYEKIAAAMGTGVGVVGAFCFCCLICCGLKSDEAQEEDVSLDHAKPNILRRASTSISNFWKNPVALQSARGAVAGDQHVVVNEHVPPPPYTQP